MTVKEAVSEILINLKSIEALFFFCTIIVSFYMLSSLPLIVNLFSFLMAFVTISSISVPLYIFELCYLFFVVFTENSMVTISKVKTEQGDIFFTNTPSLNPIVEEPT